MSNTTEDNHTVNMNIKEPLFRPLKVYAFDPTRGRTLGNHMLINTPYEKLEPGPKGRQLEVIDYDANNECYYQAVDLEDPKILLMNGLDPDESNPLFHQQMVYAVANETIMHFQYALGRTIKWSFSKRGGHRSEWKDPDYRKLLRIFPHAMQEANAFYSKELRALLFGYFSSQADSELNLPGQTVFTCLSHDIIAHETTHALIDSQKDYFAEPTSVDAPAFHEAFADIVALFQHFTFKEPLLEVIRETGGKIFLTETPPLSIPDESGPRFQAEIGNQNPLVELALQFGEAMGMRKALRSAIGSRPKSKDLEKLYEPHIRGSILVAAIFDAFFTVYLKRTRDLMRMTNASRVSTSDNMHPDLVNRLADTATKTALHFLNICIRALDYCPPVDILFGDFLRAMITSNYNLFPEDKYGYRAAIMDAFRSRGIIPEDVNSFSEESILWYSPKQAGDNLPSCTGLRVDLFSADVDKIKEKEKNNFGILHEFASTNADSLHLNPNLPIWVRSFQVGSLHIHETGRPIIELVVELLQKREVPLDPDDPTSPVFTFRGGTTLILDNSGQVRYIIHKKIGDEKGDIKNKRLKRQRDYLSMYQSNLAMASYADTAEIHKRFMSRDFGMIHRGY
jgi:hypothetical protein